jgi:regulator of protease activity HflC (stomatin/prohibitin superfamily)
MVYDDRRGLLRTLFVEYRWQTLIGSAFLITALVLGFFWFSYTNCRIDVPGMHYAVLIKKTGNDMTNGMEIAPGEDYKGVQLAVLNEGRYFYNPWNWDWEVYPMVEIPEDKMGVRLRLYGDDLGYGEFVADKDTEKGIIPEVLRPGRYAINALIIDGKTKQPINNRPKADYVEVIELWNPKIIPAGFRGVVTNLSGPLPTEPNTLLVKDGERGPQPTTLEEGTEYINPYQNRINALDTRSQRFNLSGEGYELGFPSKDGFWVELDGVIEFRVIPERAAEVYVLYDDTDEQDTDIRTSVSDEIIQKVILPNARAFCRLRGSSATGREFIGGDTRTAFQVDFEKAIAATCKEQGIEIVQALITRIKPPQPIAGPVRDREIAVQRKSQYDQEKLQQDQEALLAKEKALVEQLKLLVDADKEVVKETTLALQEQGIALEQANQRKEVAVEMLAAAKDQADAILSRAKAEAAVVNFKNEADAAGWKKSVQALGNNGQRYADYILYQKLAPGFQNIMTNTADSKFMQWFESFGQQSPQPTRPIAPVEGGDK